VLTDKRRASPLLVHVHVLANGRCVPVVSFLPARFLPKDDNKVTFTGPHGSARVNAPRGFRAVERFLAYLQRWSHDVEIASGGRRNV
jgi:hypothetical protein